jgi:hypothetical protein
MFKAAQSFSPARTIDIERRVRQSECASQARGAGFGAPVSRHSVNLIATVYTARLVMHYFQLREGSVFGAAG